MFCDNVKCNRIVMDKTACKHCRLSLYCSFECMEEDWEDIHKYICPSIKNLTLDDFEILSLLGKGSSGEAYRISHKQTGKQFAMKMIRKPSLHENQFKMLREIEIQRKQHHQHIIKLFTYFEDKYFVYILLEYAENGSLFTYIRNRKLGESQVCSFFAEVALGLYHLHKNLIIHRDLKPENILLDDSFKIKICDFGTSVQALGKRNTFTGTLQFMAPEILNQSGHSFEVDLWALGILLYELLHGKPPFHNKFNDNEFLIQASEEAEDLIKRLIRKSPQERICLIDVLAHPWIKKHVNCIDYFVGQTVNHPVFGRGEIINIEGLVCKVTNNGNFYEVPAIELHKESYLKPFVWNSFADKNYYEKEERMLNTLERICEKKKNKRALSSDAFNCQLDNCDFKESRVSDKVMRSCSSTEISKSFCNTEFSPEMLMIRQKELDRLSLVIQEQSNASTDYRKKAPVKSFWSKLFGC